MGDDVLTVVTKDTENNKYYLNYFIIYLDKFNFNPMTTYRKLNTLAEADNKKLVDELCAWIDSNLDTALGLNELVEKTKLSNKDIQYLFEKFKQTTPMTYIREKRAYRDSRKKYIIAPERITPIFIRNSDD